MQVFFNRHSLVVYKKMVSSFIALTFLTSLIVAPAGAQVLPVLNTSVSLVNGFQPPVLLGLKIHPENPLLFDFIVDQGEAKLSTDELKQETTKLVKYFLAALTIPDKEVWVNLSPTEKDRIIPDVLGQTTMGKTMLEQDYVLKQLASSLTNPETDLGKKYWASVGNAGDRSLQNKVWIMPDKAEVLESNGIVLVGEKRLKVMLDEEYQAVGAYCNTPLQKNVISSQIFRTTILPEINRQVNESKAFADVRQIYNSVILAAWYKKALKESLLGKIYADKGKVLGVETDDKEMKQRIYEQYLAAFKKGAYNLIKEEEDENGELIPRKYFSGGAMLGEIGEVLGVSAASPAQIQNALQGGPQISSAAVQLAEPAGEETVVSNAAQAQEAGASSSITITLPQDQELLGPKFKEGILSGSIGVGTKIDSFTYWVMDNEQGTSTKTKVENIDVEKGIIKFEGYAPMSLDKIISVTLAASSASGDGYIASSSLAEKIVVGFMAGVIAFNAFAVGQNFAEASRAGNPEVTVEQARKQADLNLKEMVEAYKAKNSGQLVPARLNLGQLANLLNTAKISSFDDLTAATSKALKAISDTAKKVEFEQQLAQWLYDFMDTMAVYNKQGAAAIERAAKEGKPINPADNPANWNTFISAKLGSKTFICQNASELFVMLMAELRGFDDGAYSVVQVLKDHFGKDQTGLVGHVAVFVNPSYGKPSFIDLAMRETRINQLVDRSGAVISKTTENRPIWHQGIVVYDATGNIMYKVGVNPDGSNVKGLAGLRAGDLAQFIRARQLYIELGRLNSSLPSKIDTKNVDQVRGTLFQQGQGVAELLEIIYKNPRIGHDPAYNKSLQGFLNALASNLRGVEDMLSQMAAQSVPAPVQSSPGNNKSMKEFLASFENAKNLYAQADKAYQAGDFKKAHKLFGGVATASLQQLSILTKTPGLKPGQSDAKDDQSRFIGIGHLTSKFVELLTASTFNQRVSFVKSLEKERISFSSPYETRLTASLQDGTAQTAASSTIEITLTGQAVRELRGRGIDPQAVQVLINRAIESNRQGGTAGFSFPARSEGQLNDAQMDRAAEYLGFSRRGNNFYLTRGRSFADFINQLKDLNIAIVRGWVRPEIENSLFLQRVQLGRRNFNKIEGVEKIAAFLETQTLRLGDKVKIRSRDGRDFRGEISEIISSGMPNVIDENTAIRVVDRDAGKKAQGIMLREISSIEVISLAASSALTLNAQGQAEVKKAGGNRPEAVLILLEKLKRFNPQDFTEEGKVELLNASLSDMVSDGVSVKDLQNALKFLGFKNSDLETNTQAINSKWTLTNPGRFLKIIDVASSQLFADSAEVTSSAIKVTLTDAGIAKAKEEGLDVPSIQEILDKITNMSYATSQRDVPIVIAKPFFNNEKLKAAARVLGFVDNFEIIGSVRSSKTGMVLTGERGMKLSFNDLGRDARLRGFISVSPEEVQPTVTPAASSASVDGMDSLSRNGVEVKTASAPTEQDLGELIPSEEQMGTVENLQRLIRNIENDWTSLSTDYANRLIGEAMQAYGDLGSPARIKLDGISYEYGNQLLRWRQVIDKELLLRESSFKNQRPYIPSGGRSDGGSWLAPNLQNYNAGLYSHVTSFEGLYRIVFVSDRSEQGGFLRPKGDEPVFFNSGGEGQAARVRLTYGAGVVPLIFRAAELENAGLSVLTNRGEPTINAPVSLALLTPRSKAYAWQALLTELAIRNEEIDDSRKNIMANVLGFKSYAQLTDTLSPFVDELLKEFSAASAPAAEGDFTKGGIDFDPTNMNLQIKRDGRGVPLPLPEQNLEQINIQGLFPVIINITPINSQTLPFLLGEAPKEPAREPQLAASTAS